MGIVREKAPARVTDNEDPERRGRVKVTCAALMGDDETELPDWIEPSFKWGSFQVPDVGELIEIEFNTRSDQAEETSFQAFLENPNIKWSGTRFDSLDAGTQRPFDPFFRNKHYGKRRGYATPAGHVLMFDDTHEEQQITLSWRRGDNRTQMTMDKEGSILLLDHKSNMIHVNAKDDQEGITVLDANGNMVALREKGVVVNDSYNNFIELKDGVVAVSAGGAMQVQAGSTLDLQSGIGQVNISMAADGKLDVVAADQVTVTTAAGVEVTAVSDVEVTTPADVNVTCANAKVDAAAYALGLGADSPLVRYTDWVAWADSHTHPTAFGPSGPPIVPAASIPTIPSAIGTLKCSWFAVLLALIMFFWMIL